MEYMDDKARIVELKHRLLNAACMLAVDKQYSREDAVEDIKFVLRELYDMERHVTKY